MKGGQCGIKDKTLYLVRHAESTHNVFASENPLGGDPFLWDARISPHGEEQVRGLGLKVNVFIPTPFHFSLFKKWFIL